MRTIEFTGDPMLQIEEFEDKGSNIFYLNHEALLEIKSYSEEKTAIDLKDDEEVANFFGSIPTDKVLFAAGGTDDNGDEFPDTYIGIKNVEGNEYPYIISGIYASDFQYVVPNVGEAIYLKKQKQR